MKRYESLDWLRGLMAFAIMIYHLISWQVFHLESGSVLGNFGVYLLHPVVYMFVNKVIHQPILCIVVTSVATIIAANISYRIYEKPFIKLGKKVTTVDHRVY